MRYRQGTTALVLCGVLVPGAAWAGSGGTADTACGSTSAGWNVPKGGLVMNRSAGPVRSTLNAIGEYRTHSMLSHGPGGYVTHATMYSPGTTGWPTYCSTPLKHDDLKNGFPGASQTSQGGIYTFLYKNGSPEYIGYQNGNGDGTNKGAKVADWLWNSMPYEWVSSRKDGSNGFWVLKRGNARTNYTLYQYRTIESTHVGGSAWNNGMMCSSLLAYAQHQAGLGQINTYTYSHSKVVAAIDGLLSGVENDCSSGLGFWGGVGASITCFEGICDDAARQVANCMAVGRCDTDTDGSNSYRSVRNDGNTVAVSISPDRLGGWSGHPWTGEGVSVWAYDNARDVQWNSGGNVYGCWF